MAEKKEEDGLFLLEVLVDKILFTQSPCFTDKDFRTCVNVTCAGVESLEVCDDDPSACASKTGGPFVKTFNNGKSCLFSLKSSEIKTAMVRFPVKVVVSKSLPCGCLPAKIPLGEAVIDMTKEFLTARMKYLEDPNCVSYQALKDIFKLTTLGNRDTGEILMFLRISCFGKSIVTKFNATGEVTLEAAGHAGFNDRSCNPPRQYQTLDDPCVCGIGQGTVGGGGARGNAVCKAGGRSGGYGTCPATPDMYNSRPCSEPEDPCYCSGPKPKKKSDLACRNIDKYCLHIPKGRSKQYEEIGTNLTGNELKIKIPANLAVIKKISQTHCHIQTPYQKKKKGRDDHGPCNPPCAKNQISLAIPSEAVCCNGPQLTDTRFTCTTEGCLQTSKHGQVAGMARGDTKYQELPNKDVFVLKVGKTAREGDRKCKLELELVAPKAGDKLLPIRKVDERIQADHCQCCSCCRPRLKKPKK